MRMAFDDDDADGRPAVYGEDYSAERADPLLARLYRIHRQPRHDFYRDALAPEAQAGTGTVSRGRKEGHVTDVPKVRGSKRKEGARYGEGVQ